MAVELCLEALDFGRSPALPADTFVSLRVDGVQKQYPYASLQEWSFPSSGGGPDKHARMEVFQSVTQQEVDFNQLLDGSEMQAPISNPGAPFSLTLTAVRPPEEAEATFFVNKSPEKWRRMEADRRKYLENHQVKDLVGNAVRDAVGAPPTPCGARASRASAEAAEAEQQPEPEPDGAKQAVKGKQVIFFRAELTGIAEPPGDMFISVSLGGVQKQSRLAQSKTWRLPVKVKKDGTLASNVGEVKVLRRMGDTLLDLTPASQEVFVPCGNVPGSPELAFNLHVKGGDLSPSVRPPRKKVGDSTDVGLELLKQHNMQGVVHNAFKSVIRGRPRSPSDMLYSKFFVKKALLPPLDPGRVQESSWKIADAEAAPLRHRPPAGAVARSASGVRLEPLAAADAAAKVPQPAEAPAAAEEAAPPEPKPITPPELQQVRRELARVKTQALELEENLEEVTHELEETRAAAEKAEAGHAEAEAKVKGVEAEMQEVMNRYHASEAERQQAIQKAERELAAAKAEQLAAKEAAEALSQKLEEQKKQEADLKQLVDGIVEERMAKERTVLEAVTAEHERAEKERAEAALQHAQKLQQALREEQQRHTADIESAAARQHQSMLQQSAANMAELERMKQQYAELAQQREQQVQAELEQAKQAAMLEQREHDAQELEAQIRARLDEERAAAPAAVQEPEPAVAQLQAELERARQALAEQSKPASAADDPATLQLQAELEQARQRAKELEAKAAQELQEAQQRARELEAQAAQTERSAPPQPGEDPAVAKLQEELEKAKLRAKEMEEQAAAAAQAERSAPAQEDPAVAKLQEELERAKLRAKEMEEQAAAAAQAERSAPPPTEPTPNAADAMLQAELEKAKKMLEEQAAKAAADAAKLQAELENERQHAKDLEKELEEEHAAHQAEHAAPPQPTTEDPAVAKLQAELEEARQRAKDLQARPAEVASSAEEAAAEPAPDPAMIELKLELARAQAALLEERKRTEALQAQVSQQSGAEQQQAPKAASASPEPSPKSKEQEVQRILRDQIQAFQQDPAVQKLQAELAEARQALHDFEQLQHAPAEETESAAPAPTPAAKEPPRKKSSQEFLDAAEAETVKAFVAERVTPSGSQAFSRSSSEAREHKPPARRGDDLSAAAKRVHFGTVDAAPAEAFSNRPPASVSKQPLTPSMRQETPGSLRQQAEQMQWEAQEMALRAQEMSRRAFELAFRADEMNRTRMEAAKPAPQPKAQPRKMPWIPGPQHKASTATWMVKPAKFRPIKERTPYIFSDRVKEMLMDLDRQKKEVMLRERAEQTLASEAQQMALQFAEERIWWQAIEKVHRYVAEKARQEASENEAASQSFSIGWAPSEQKRPETSTEEVLQRAETSWMVAEDFAVLREEQAEKRELAMKALDAEEQKSEKTPGLEAELRAVLQKADHKVTRFLEAERKARKKAAKLDFRRDDRLARQEQANQNTSAATGWMTNQSLVSTARTATNASSTLRSSSAPKAKTLTSQAWEELIESSNIIEVSSSAEQSLRLSMIRQLEDERDEMLAMASEARAYEDVASAVQWEETAELLEKTLQEVREEQQAAERATRVEVFSATDLSWLSRSLEGDDFLE